MTVKNTQAQMDAIVQLLGILLTENEPQNIAEKLVYNIVFKLYQKFRAQSEMLKLKAKGYSLNLNDNEALALYVFVQNVHIPTAQYQYEALQLTRVFNEIDKQHA
jgi:hypothetical protein